MILYDTTKSFEYNAKNGVKFEGKIPERVIPDKALWHPFFDYKIVLPLNYCGELLYKDTDAA